MGVGTRYVLIIGEVAEPPYFVTKKRGAAEKGHSIVMGLEAIADVPDWRRPWTPLMENVFAQEGAFFDERITAERFQRYCVMRDKGTSLYGLGARIEEALPSLRVAPLPEMYPTIDVFWGDYDLEAPYIVSADVQGNMERLPWYEQKVRELVINLDSALAHGKQSEITRLRNELKKRFRTHPDFTGAFDKALRIGTSTGKFEFAREVLSEMY